jgi:hypothetical protein
MMRRPRGLGRHPNPPMLGQSANRRAGGSFGLACDLGTDGSRRILARAAGAEQGGSQWKAGEIARRSF